MIGVYISRKIFFCVMSTALIVMTLNEVDGIRKIMPKVKKEWVDEIVIVDGGSTDGTIKEVEKLGLKIIHQKKKKIKQRRPFQSLSQVFIFLTCWLLIMN